MVALMVLDVIMNASRIPDRDGDGGVEIVARHHAHIDASGVAFTYRRADLQHQGQRTSRAHLGRISELGGAHLGPQRVLDSDDTDKGHLGLHLRNHDAITTQSTTQARPPRSQARSSSCCCAHLERGGPV